MISFVLHYDYHEPSPMCKQMQVHSQCALHYISTSRTHVYSYTYLQYATVFIGQAVCSVVFVNM